MKNPEKPSACHCTPECQMFCPVNEKMVEKDKEIERLNHEIERLKGPSQAERILATDRSNVIP